MYSFKVSKNMKKVDVFAYDACDVWAAAVYAQRINGAYLKQNEIDHEGKVVKDSNREIARLALQDGGKITVEDRCKGALIRQFISSRLMIRAITKKLSSFETNLSKAVSMEEFIVPQDRMSIGIVNSQIAQYEKIIKEEELTKDYVYGTFGKINERLEIKVKPVARFWLTDWGTFRYNSITEDGYKTSFYYRDKLEIGDAVEVRGTVKKHTNDTTTINRVKVLK